MKYYAVKNGRKVGIFTSWDECRTQINGYSSAIYKSFTTLEDAKAYLGENKENSDIASCNLEFSGAICYVDGSFNTKTLNFSYGVVVLYNGEEHHFNQKFDDSELALMRNVAGEIKGSQFAMEYCIKNNIKDVKIYYDYEGVSRWCLGEWKTNKEGTRAYKEYYNSIKDKLNVTFIKVKSHSGDKYNDLADELAKKALGII